ncbi:hypothetical protein NDU88_007966 [Pleurodeles waltl]|uniref:Uncharacterized protein n=1 Tax=Pleurodeles waltl TaxID=8319 RepID=A0AAV7PP27_PLEWA|nr:hypothetical protein NDU88_007966 [Pleurodeles waltl]
MIAHMRAEALKRGKDWLHAKMEEKGEENQSQDFPAPALPILADETGAAEGISPPPQKANKRQRTEGKPARKTTKKARDMVLTTLEHTTTSPAKWAASHSTPRPGSASRPLSAGESLPCIADLEPPTYSTAGEKYNRTRVQEEEPLADYVRRNDPVRAFTPL